MIPPTLLFFQAQAETVWGQSVEVRGDQSVLGSWNSGLALQTDASTYPIWSNAEPVRMPLSTFFEWKLVKAQGSDVIWEAGANRTGFAAPTALSPNSTLTGSWR